MISGGCASASAIRATARRCSTTCSAGRRRRRPQLIREAVLAAADAVPVMLSDGAQIAMNRLHQPRIPAGAAARRARKSSRRHGHPLRHRGSAERRQVDAVQRADAGADRRRELSLLHHRSQRRRGPGAGPAPAAAGRHRASGEDRPGHRGVRRHRGAGRGRLRRARASATSSCRTSARSMPSRTWCAASRAAMSSTSRARSIRSPTSRRSTPSSRWRISPRWRRRSSAPPRPPKSGDKDALRKRALLERVKAQLDAGAAGAGAGSDARRSSATCGSCTC